MHNHPAETGFFCSKLRDNCADITAFDQILAGLFQHVGFFLVCDNEHCYYRYWRVSEAECTYFFLFSYINDMWFAVQKRLEGLENNYTGPMLSFHVRMISAFWPKVFVRFITINKGSQVAVFKLHSFKYKG